MKTKKLIALGLAVVTVLSLGIPALAEDTVIKGMYKEIKIDVEIPTTGDAVINPYNMPVKAVYKPESGEPEELTALTTAGKIATQPLIGISTCEVALDVGATVTGVPKGDLMLANKDISAAKTKSAVVYLECKQDITLANADVSSTASDKPISGIKGARAVAAFNAWDASSYNFGTDDAAKKANSDKVLVTEGTSTKMGLCTLTAAKLNGTEMQPQTGSFLLARLGGDVVQNPTDPWAAKDGVEVNVAFTFTPAGEKQGKDFAEDATEPGSVVKLTAALPAGVATNGDATYKWELVDGGTAKIVKIKPGTETTAQATFFDADDGGTNIVAGKFKAKCTVTDDGGIKYVTVQEITVAPAS